MTSTRARFLRTAERLPSRDPDSLTEIAAAAESARRVLCGHFAGRH
ncbi:hypothetical protein [Streptomyces sp. NPDC048392]